MTVWSASGVPTRFVETAAGFALVDRTGHRIDWPLISTRAGAEVELHAFRRELRGLRRDEQSEAFGLRRMGAK